MQKTFCTWCFGNNPCEDFNTVNCVLLKQWSNFFILPDADARKNASTSTVRLLASSGGKPHSLVLRLVSATLWGPAHWRRKRAGISMLEENRRCFDNIDTSSQRKKQKDPFDYGVSATAFTKTLTLVPKSCAKPVTNVLLLRTNLNDPLLKIAKRLEADSTLNRSILCRA